MGLMDKLSNFRPVTNFMTQCHKDPMNSLTKAAVYSMVAKDAIGCAFYVYQSATNPAIPREKKAFVVSLDAVNGGLMILMQLLMFKVVNKHSGKWARKLFKGLFDNKIVKNAKTEMRVDQKLENVKPKRKGIIEEEDRIPAQNFAKGLIKSIIEMTATAIVAKRIIVPFIATPLAGVAKKWIEKKFPPEENDKEQVKVQNKNNTPKLDVVSSGFETQRAGVKK